MSALLDFFAGCLGGKKSGCKSYSDRIAYDARNYSVTWMEELIFKKKIYIIDDLWQYE